MTKAFTVVGYQFDQKSQTIMPAKFNCLLTESGSIQTLSVDNGRVQYTFSLKAVLEQAGEDTEEEE